MTEVILGSGIPFSLALIAWIVSLLRGAAPERLLTATLLMVAGFGVALHYLHASAGYATVWGNLIIDAAAFGVIGAVALRANRVYPIWVGALQIVKLTSDIWRVWLVRPALSAHFVVDEAAIYLQLAIMALGLASHIARRQHQQNIYPDWVPANS
jgi:hypothetical protein